MGGDILNKLLGSYRPKIRSKKSWWNLFINALTMVVVSSWIIHSEVNENKLSHLEYCRQITTFPIQSKECLVIYHGPSSHVKKSMNF